jgi:hypothetical protein
VAFLVTFSVLLVGAVIWLGLFVGLSELHTEMLKTIAEWLSPERVSGWIFYVAICVLGFVPIARRFLVHGKQDP